MGLFDERNLLEISSPDFPGERLVALKVRPIHHHLENRVRAHIFSVHAGLLRGVAHA